MVQEEDKINKLINMIDNSQKIVVFTGAGVSTDSGLKDFRSENGLYKKALNAEYYLSRSCFLDDPALFYNFYIKNFNCLKIKPNSSHYFFKKLEDMGKLTCIVTQNIDGLHQKAGSNNVYEIHGTIYKNHCVKCHAFYDAEYVFKSSGIPKCTCGGIIKPDVVLYEEALPSDAFDASIKSISNADMLIIAGSSLTVYPAAGLIDYFRGKYLVILNKDSLACDSKASLVINNNISSVCNLLLNHYN